MGVAGCGKSSVGQELARELGLPLIEGDDFHSTANVAKMRAGVPLTDDDRAEWLATLTDQLRIHGQTGVVLTCSALRQRYRNQLRQGVADLRFVHLRLDKALSLQRVGARPGHFFSATLVDSQFAALEDPAGEPGVVTVDAALPLADVVAQAAAALRAHGGQP